MGQTIFEANDCIDRAEEIPGQIVQVDRLLDELPAGASLRRSSELVRGHWWRTLGFTALVDALAVLSGPLLGVGLLLLTDHSLTFINLAASLVYTFTVPYAAIQLTLYYFDLEARATA